MKWLRKILDSQAPLFEEKGKLEKLYPLYEAADTFLYTPGETTRGPSHVRDALDLKRMMSIVVLILVYLYKAGSEFSSVIINHTATVSSYP